MKMIKKLLTTLLVLLSITAFANAANISDIQSIDQTNTDFYVNPGSSSTTTFCFMVDAPASGSSTFNLPSANDFTFNGTRNGGLATVSLSGASASFDATSFTVNSAHNMMNCINHDLTINVPAHQPAGDYYNFTHFLITNTTDNFGPVSARVIVNELNTSSVAFTDSTLNVENGTNAIFNLNINNTGNLDYTFVLESVDNLKLNKNNQVNLTGTNQVPANAIGASAFTAGEEHNITITFATNSSSNFGVYTGNVVYSLNGLNSTLPISVTILPESHNTRLELDYDLDDVTNDDSDTYPGDYMRISDIEINNEYTNDEDDSIEDIELEYNVYRVSDGDDIIEEEHSKAFDLEEDQKADEFDIQFQVPFDAEAGKYIVEVIITGEISSDGSDDGEKISNRMYETFTVDRDSRHVIPTNFELLNSCSANSKLMVDLTNIGTSDLDEDDDIYVQVRIPELDHSKWYFFNDSIDSEDTEQIEIDLELPLNTEDGNYIIELTSKHDGNSNSNKDGSKLSSTFNLDCGNTRSDSSDILITGQTSEDGKSGSQTKYTLSLTNRKDITVKYDLSIDEFN